MIVELCPILRLRLELGVFSFWYVRFACGDCIVIAERVNCVVFDKRRANFN